MATMSEVSCVAEEIGSKVGQISGYSTRLEDRTKHPTRIKYMTDF